MKCTLRTFSIFVIRNKIIITIVLWVSQHNKCSIKKSAKTRNSKLLTFPLREVIEFFTFGQVKVTTQNTNLMFLFDLTFSFSFWYFKVFLEMAFNLIVINVILSLWKFTSKHLNFKIPNLMGHRMVRGWRPGLDPGGEVRGYVRLG